jgi:hypothetical protein
MKAKKNRTDEKGAVDIIEETTRMLRMLPAGTLGLYYAGSLPFVLAFLYFWADMSRGAFAHQYAAKAALSLTVLYIWMKCWQAAFCIRLKADLLGEAPPVWTVRRVLRVIAVQTAVQPFAFVALPVASVLMLPFVRVYAYFHHASAAEGAAADIRDISRQAWREAGLFPAQAHIFVMIYSLLGAVVFLNCGTIIYLAPVLLNAFLGVETAFSRASWGMFNTTLLMTTAAVTYLLTNPLAKAAFVLRSFYGESLKTGADLMVELAKLKAAAKVAAVALLLGTLVFGGTFDAAAEGHNAASPAVQPAASAIAPSDLDRSIREVIAKREYSWRMPKEKIAPEEEKGIVGRFLAAVMETLKDWLRPVGKWMKKALNWLVERIVGWLMPSQAEKKAEGDWIEPLRIALTAVVAVAAAFLLFVLWRVYRGRRTVKPAAALPLAASAPDITKEETQADELPADGWIRMGDDFAARGDMRSALRAYFLAILALLARRNAIVIARYKSNREYERELYRKAHHAPDLLAAFSGNMHLFEGIWYGAHEAGDDAVRTFRENQSRITAVANQL